MVCCLFFSAIAVSFGAEFVDQGWKDVVRQMVDELADGSEFLPAPAASGDNDAAAALRDRGWLIYKVSPVVALNFSLNWGQ